MFKIKSISAGWFMGEIGDEKQRHFFDYSYLSDFISDFMSALLFVHGDWEPIWCSNKFRTELEPAVEDWIVLFLTDFLREMERILVLYGLVGYRENWNYEFPLSLYLMLKNISKGKNKLAINKLKPEEHYGTEALASDFDKEIKLLRG